MRARLYLSAAAVLVLAALPPNAAAQAAAATDSPCASEGLVTDATGLPLPGATVTIDPGGASTTSDEVGRFCVRLHGGSADQDPPYAPSAEKTPRDAPSAEKNPPDDDAVFAVIASLPGFTPQRLEIDARQDVRRPVTFRLAPEFADRIVVTGTRTGQRLDDTPVRTELVDRAAMDRVAARTLADAVEFTTGVRVEANCQNCNFSQIRLLGLEGPYTQILIDSQPVISSLAQVYGIEQLPARMIERIEVVKGGGSALYGPGSVGGVVNVISREPARSGGVIETRGELVEGIPNYSFSGAADWVDAAQQTYLTAYAQTDRVKPVDLTGDGFTEVTRRSLGTAGVRVARYLLANRAKLTVDGTRMTEDRRGGNLLRLPPHEADITEAIASRRHAGSATWFHAPSGRFDYRGTFALASTDRDSYYGAGRDPNAYGRTGNLLGVLDTQLNHYVRRHTVSWGVQASSESLDDEQPAYGRFTAATYRNAGIFAQDDWTIVDGWQIVLGVRADRHSAVDATIASPRAALMVSPRENVDIRVSAARGFRAPQVFDEDLHLSSVAGEARIIRLAPALREERSTNVMAGAEWKPELWRGQALLEVNAFHTRLTDLFHVAADDDSSTPEFEFTKSNFGAASVYGFELNAGWGIEDRLIFQGGIVEQRARFDRPEPDFGSRDFFRSPRRYGNATATWTHARAGEVFVGVRITGSMSAPHYRGYVAENRLERTPLFAVIDASWARPLASAGSRRLTLTVMARNLTGAYQRDLDQGPLRDAAYVYGPRFPRSLSIGLRAEM